MLLLYPAIAFAQNLEPTEEKALLNVLVSNEQKQPLEGEFVSFIASKNKKVYAGRTNADGRFSILIPIGNDYDVRYTNFMEEIEYSSISLPAEKGLYTIDYTITFEPSQTIVLENVEYDLNKATLRPSSYKTLNDLVKVMKSKDKMKIEIAGHTDNTGSDEYNLKLSQERAGTIRSYLISKGIKADRVVAKGYGSEQPIAPNSHADGSDNPDGRQRNRRTEVRIITP